MGTIAEWIAALGGGGAIGGGLKWAFDRWAKARKSREERLAEREELYVTKLEKRLDALEKDVAHQGAELEKHRIALGILIAKEERMDPGSVELRQVRAILGAAYPVRPDIPDAKKDILGKI